MSIWVSIAFGCDIVVGDSSTYFIGLKPVFTRDRTEHRKTQIIKEWIMTLVAHTSRGLNLTSHGVTRMRFTSLLLDIFAIEEESKFYEI